MAQTFPAGPQLRPGPRLPPTAPSRSLLHCSHPTAPSPAVGRLVASALSWARLALGRAGENGLWVVPFPGPGGGWLVSAGGGSPVWPLGPAGTGREVFFQDLKSQTIMFASYTPTGDALVFDKPREWSPHRVLDLGSPPVFLPILLYALIIVCCGFVYQAYEELLNDRKASPRAALAISRAVGPHMMMFGLIFLSAVLLAIVQQWDGTLDPLFGLGRGRLLGHAGVLGCTWIAEGVGHRR
jgi:hypothetical protein